MTPEKKAIELLGFFIPKCIGGYTARECCKKLIEDCKNSAVYSVVHYSKIEDESKWHSFVNYWDEVLIELDKTMII